MTSWWSVSLFLRVGLLAGVLSAIFGSVWYISAGTAPETVQVASNTEEGTPNVPRPPKESQPPVEEARDSHKPLVLSEAIDRIAKEGRGSVVKAETTGTGDATKFLIEVLAKDGTRIQTTLDVHGQVVGEPNIVPAKDVTTTRGKGTTGNKDKKRMP